MRSFCTAQILMSHQVPRGNCQAECLTSTSSTQWRLSLPTDVLKCHEEKLVIVGKENQSQTYSGLKCIDFLHIKKIIRK